jgi:hypothetical protein
MGNNPVQRPLPDDPTGYYKELRAGFDLRWTLRNLGNKSATLCYYPGPVPPCFIKFRSVSLDFARELCQIALSPPC